MYLGGIHPQELTAADRALQAQISGGIRHMNLHIEPFYMQACAGSTFETNPGKPFKGMEENSD